MRRHIVFAIITGFLVVLIGIWLYISNRSGAKIAFDIAPTSVQVERVDHHNMPVVANSIGELVAPQSVVIMSQVSGIVDKINFKSGQLVKKGDVLLLLENTQQQADLASSEAAFQKAKQQYERMSRLYNDSKAVSKEALDNAQSQYLQSKAELDIAQYQLSNTEIRAPFDGVLSMTQLAVGSYVSEGDAIVSIVNKQNLQVEYALSEKYASELKTGQTTEFYSDAWPGRTFKAIVDYISPDVSSDNLTFSVRAYFDNNDDLLSPGMSVNVTQVLKAFNPELAVPESAIHTQSGGFVVYRTILNTDSSSDKAVYTAKMTPVEVSGLYDGYMGIVSGLEIGEPVIISTNSSLSDGLRVKVEAP
ncbi:MAG: efflux RND transporter periplasmic adaptor subunit [Francisellaceae bacterium]